MRHTALVLSLLHQSWMTLSSLRSELHACSNSNSRVEVAVAHRLVDVVALLEAERMARTRPRRRRCGEI
jgi:hypothetical protein